MTEIRFSSYQPGDEEHILELFSKCFPGRQMSPEYWKWKFQLNPAGQAHIRLAWCDDVLAGHAAVSPVMLHIYGADHFTGMYVTLMTHPSFRGRGLFPELANQIDESLARESYSLVWTLPNRALSHRGFVSKLGWRDIYEIPTFAVDVEVARPSDGTNSVVELTGFSPNFSELWEKARQSYGVLAKRDQIYLKWRFQCKPNGNYRVLGHVTNKELKGYLVFNIYRENEFQIVDMLTLPDPNIPLELVTRTINIAKTMKMKTVKMWLPVNQRLHHELERLGFANNAPITYFCAKALHDTQYIDQIWDANRWLYTMSDSDNF